MVLIIPTIFSVSYSEIVTAQNNLRTLGFYDGPNSGYVSDEMRQSIRNFQRVYGMPTTGSLTENVAAKINEVYSKYTSIYNSTSLNSIASNAEFSLDATEKKNFALIWTFLDKSMGLTGNQIVGVMANIRAESGYSSDNLEGTASDHDRDYVYNTVDGKGYGIIQWTISTRKQELKNMANTMGLDVSDINAQLAYFRKEMTTNFNNLYFVNSWNSLKETTSYIDACDVFLEEIEMPKKLNYDERREFATIIYNAMTTGGII